MNAGAGGGAAAGGSAGANTAAGSGGAAGTSGSSGSTSLGGEAGALGTEPMEMALAKLPEIRQEHSVVALNGEVYVVGGYTPGNGGGLTPTDSVIAYDPVKNSWRDVKSFPGQLNHANIGVIGGKIYVGGFYTANGMTAGTTQSFVYDPAGDAWTEISPLPEGTERGAGCVAIVDDLMYVVGGQNNGKSVAYAARYDPKTDHWEALPDLPERKEHCAAAGIDGIVYIVGGRVDGITTFQPKSYAFDPKTMQWSDRAPIITPRGGLAGGVLGKKLYVFGGEGDPDTSKHVFPDIDVYDPATDSWAKVGEMLIPRHGYNAAVVDNKVYLPGGATQQGGGASDNNSVWWLE
jgi:N-acetylneuraminic acid mutarotase